MESNWTPHESEIHPQLLTIPLALDINGLVSYSDKSHAEWAYDVRAEGFSDVLAAADLSYPIHDTTTVSVGVAYSSLLDDRYRDWFDILDVHEDNVWGNVGLTFSF